MANRKKGTVKWFHTMRGFGFITDEEGADYFVHFSQIRMEGLKKLHEGQLVEFDPFEEEDGRSIAKDVTIME